MGKAKTPIPVPGGNEPKSEHLMMRGSEKNLDYLVIARTGDVVLGLKPNAVTNGPEDTTYVGARIRSASAKGVFPDEDAVHSIAAASGNFAKAWPNILFENNNAERSSGQVCIYLKGNFKTTPDEVFAQVSEGQMGKRMAKYLIEVIGEEHMVVSEADLAAYINVRFDSAFSAIKDKIAADKKMTELVHEGIGHFGMQAALMKKVYAKTQEGQEKGPGHEADDLEEEVPDFTAEAGEEGQGDEE